MSPGIASTSQHGFAPYYVVPDVNYVTVEHPGIIRNVENAIASLGGEKRLGRFLNSQAPARSLNLSLRPDEPFRRAIESRGVTTENVILQVTVPKRTGRKRKRGSDEPFTSDVRKPRDEAKSTEFYLRSMKDNPHSTTMTPIGTTEENHRFRALPDFQWSSATSRLVNNLKASVLQPDYESLRNFKFDESKGIEKFGDMLPPPSLAQNTIPFNYGYRQNAMVKTTTDASGRQITYNRQAPVRIFTHTVTHDCPPLEIPTSTPSEAPPEESLDEVVRSLIEKTRRFLQNERPIATRRVLLNHLGQEYGNELKHVFQYCGYYFRSGPWRDALIPFGIDPRTDPKYRVYQTMTFKVVVRTKDNEPEDRTKWNRSLRLNPSEAPDNMTHIFDGTRVTADAKVWHACDITDSLIRSILDSDGPRETCDALQDGWYLNGAWAKARVIMRDKISLIMSNVTPSDSVYDRLVAIPNQLTAENLQSLTFFAKKDGVRVMEMAGDIRQMARVQDQTDRGKVRRSTATGALVRRSSSRKPSTMPERDDTEAIDDDLEVTNSVAEGADEDDPLDMDA